MYRTLGLLLRTKIIASELVPVGKETDRRWEQGEDSSLVDLKVTEFRTTAKMAVAESSERKKWKELGVRNIMRKSGLSQKAVYATLAGKPVRLQTMAHLKACMTQFPP